MDYFIDCDRCHTAVRVTPLDTRQHRSKICDNCGAELVFANHELQEWRILVVFRCHNPKCAALEKPQELPITRTALRKMSQPGSEDKFMCSTCREQFPLSDQEKANNLRMLDEEEARAKAS